MKFFPFYGKHGICLQTIAMVLVHQHLIVILKTFLGALIHDLLLFRLILHGNDGITRHQCINSFLQVESLNSCTNDSTRTCMCITEVYLLCKQQKNSVFCQNIFDAFLVICLDAVPTMTAVVGVAVGCLNAYFVIFFLHSHTAALLPCMCLHVRNEHIELKQKCMRWHIASIVKMLLYNMRKQQK